MIAMMTIMLTSVSIVALIRLSISYHAEDTRSCRDRRFDTNKLKLQPDKAEQPHRSDLFPLRSQCCFSAS